MEYIKKEELIKGEVYRHDNGNLVQYLYDSNDTQIHGHFIGDKRNVFRNYNDMISNFTINKLKLATSEEKHWLETCIIADKFIEYDEAMKSFIPEYVECVESETNGFTKNKIYKVEDKFSHGRFSSLDNDNRQRFLIMNGGIWKFKPSTKKAYDAQFQKEVVKVKPFEILETCRKNPNRIKQVINEEGNIFMIGDMITPTIKDSPNKGKRFKITGFRLNNDKSMICAITDTHTPYGIGIDKIEHFIEKEVFVLPEHWFIKTTIDTFNIIRNWANKKINNDVYNTYIHHNNVNFNYKGLYRRKHGCIEITFDQFKKYVLNKQELSPIQLANIQHPELAIDYPPVVIAQGHSDQLKLKQSGIDSIFIPNETLLEKAKRLYPIGTKFKCVNGNDKYEEFSIVESYDNKVNFEGECLHSGNSWIVLKGKWAEIIEDKPKVGDKFKLNIGNKFMYYSDKIYTITKIIECENSYCEFKNENNYNCGRVLLKNIKIIK